MDEIRTKLKNLLAEHNLIDKYKIYFMQILRNENERDGQCDMAERTIELTHVYDAVDDSGEHYVRKQYLRFVGMIIMALLFRFLMSNILTGFNYYFLATKDVDVLKQHIISDKFIPANYDVNDIATDEIFLTSWDINSRTPRFFTKWSKQNINLFKNDDK